MNEWMKEIIDNSTNKKEHAPTLYPAEQSKKQQTLYTKSIE